MLYKVMQNFAQKHVNSRWLSLERTAKKILWQYASLNSYFQNEDPPKSIANPNCVESEWGDVKRFKRLKKAFDEVYLYFFSGVLPIFKQTNLFLQ